MPSPTPKPKKSSSWFGLSIDQQNETKAQPKSNGAGSETKPQGVQPNEWQKVLDSYNKIK